MTLSRNARRASAAAWLTMFITVASARAGVLTTQTFFLPSGPGNPASAPYETEVLSTNPLTTWGQRGALGVQGSQSIFPDGNGGYVNVPASTVAFKFNVGAAVNSLNATYGAGNWAIASPKLTFQYTYYANNSIFGGGAGSFETYWVANDSWAFGNGASSGNKYGDNNYVAGTDPVFATTAAALSPWSGGQADLGSTAYNWPSPANNPNYSGWSTDKVGPNQGMLTASLAADPLFAADIQNASALSNPNVSLYLMPNNDALGLTIFVGGGNVTPELSFDVVSAPEPTASVIFATLGGMTALLCRRRLR